MEKLIKFDSTFSGFFPIHYPSIRVLTFRIIYTKINKVHDDSYYPLIKRDL